MQDMTAEEYRQSASLPDTTFRAIDTIRWGVLVFPNSPMLAYSALIEPLRAANVISGHTLYDWVSVSPSGPWIDVSNGLKISADCSAEVAPSVDRLIVVAGPSRTGDERAAALSWIRREARRGSMIGGVSEGSFVLAEAGLLEGYSCTVHWRIQPSFREAFPTVDCRREIFVVDRDRATAAGGIGAFDMMLSLIEGDVGESLAGAISEWFVHRRLSETVGQETLSVRLRTGVRNPRVVRAIELMEQNIEEPLMSTSLADRLGVSVDTLERAFKRETNQSVIQYYRSVRFRHAQDLLRSSTLRIGEIAVACGFSDSSSFARSYRSYFGISPRAHRPQLKSAREA